MNYYLPIPISLIALLLFAYMRNMQAARNDKRRERLWRMQEKLINMLQNQHAETGDDK